jgi:hypothetical protein
MVKNPTETKKCGAVPEGKTPINVRNPPVIKRNAAPTVVGLLNETLYKVNAVKNDHESNEYHAIAEKPGISSFGSPQVTESVLSEHEPGVSLD